MRRALRPPIMERCLITTGIVLPYFPFEMVHKCECYSSSIRGSVVGIATKLRAGRSEVPISVGASDFTLLQSSQSPNQLVPGFLPRNKAAGT
jgi:hypothetical protein